MSRKLSIEFIKKEFDKEGYTLLSDVYTGAKCKLNYRCPVGHEHSITWSNWNLGSRCPHCAGVGIPDFGKVKAEFEAEGYRLLSSKYVSYKSKLKYVCPKGHVGSISRSNWLAGRRCSQCSVKTIPTQEKVEESFRKEGYKLLSVYNNSYTKLKYECPLGHIGKITWDSWNYGNRCNECRLLNFSGPSHPNWKGGISFEPYCEVWKDKDFKESIKERDGYTCLNPDCYKKDDRITIHHIDYNKKNCSPDNLITLCSSCNSRANFNREWHKAWYQAIIKNRYRGGQNANINR